MSLLADISYQYGIQICKCTRVKDIYKIDTQERGSWCLKPYHLPVDEVEFIAAVQSHLTQNGFLYGPQTRRTRFDDSYIENGGTYYMLTNWIFGANPDFHKRIELKSSIRTLAIFHRHTKYLRLAAIPKRRMRVFGLEERFRNGLQVVESNSQSEPSKFHAIRELFGKAFQQLGDVKVRRAIEHEANVKAFIHGDYNYPNLVVDKRNGACQLVDFDNTSCHVRMEDLAHIIHRNCPWQAEGALRLVEIYDRIRPLRKEEFYLLIALLHEPYPFLRAIQLKKRHPKLASPNTPSRGTLKQYSRLLCMQM